MEENRKQYSCSKSQREYIYVRRNDGNILKNKDANNDAFSNLLKYTYAYTIHKFLSNSFFLHPKVCFGVITETFV